MKRSSTGDTAGGGGAEGGSIVLIEAPLVLASSSPRRHELLKELGTAFHILHPDCEEMLDASQTPSGNARRLAEVKARAGAERLDEGTVIGADTLVALGNRVIGKPRDAEEAKEILRSLAGTAHQVITGVAVRLARSGRAISAAATTEVRMRPLGEDEIEAYVASGEAFGKAGAYAVQESGDRFVEEIDGPYDNVVGLPVALVRALLDRIAADGGGPER